MSWINLNDSFNSLKGQISNFANNVLADEDEDQPKVASGSGVDLEQLQRTCSEQQAEINRLQTLIGELSQDRNTSNLPSNGWNGSNESWSWEVGEGRDSDKNKAKNIITDLKHTIDELRKEKQELISNLELLDSEHQLNTEQLVNLKDKLQRDYNELEDEYNKVKSDKKKIRREFDNLKIKYETLSQKSLPPTNNTSQESICNRCENLLSENQNFVTKIQALTSEISILNSNKATLAKILDDSKNASDSAFSQMEEKLRLCESENKILISELQKAAQSIEAFERKSAVDAENCKKLALILEGYEHQVSSLKQELLEKESFSSCNEEIDRIKSDLQQAKDQLQSVVLEKELTHTKYINILTEKMKRYVDGHKYSDETSNSTIEVDPQISEFSHQVESILNILLDLKCKCETLEKDLYNVTEEKTNMLSEKNHEIEKLIQNSEILSQEVITKTQTNKDYENECNELIKNNDLLISELEMLKNNSGLQTISESNEDNLLLLESQLENANKKIDELENIISELERKPKESIEETNEQDVNNSYQKLMEEFNQLVKDNSSLKDEIENYQQSGILINDEKEKLNSTLEKMKTDLENTEYQYMEININMEILKEEVENQKKKVQELMEQNLTLRKINMDYERSNEAIRTEHNVVREKLLLEEDARKQLESQIRNLIEKLQNAKMCETSLKLQYDTVNKELVSVAEAKHAVEGSLKNTLSSLDQCRNNLLSVQEENEKLKGTIVELENKLENNLTRSIEPYTQENKIDSGEDKFASINEQFQTVTLNDKSDEIENGDLLAKLEELQLLYNSTRDKNEQLQTEVENLTKEYSVCKENVGILEKKIEELNASKSDLTNVIITKHQESVTYHNEIKRLSQILQTEVEKNRNLDTELQSLKLSAKDSDLKIKEEEMEKLTDQNNFLRQKCEVLAQNLLDEQNKFQQILTERAGPSEREQVLSKKLERLQSHLIEIEEHYTQELLRAEEKNAELQVKVNEIEQREKNSSTMYTSVSIRANQHVETLQHQLQLITNQRDELRKKISDAEDHASKQDAALSNLQFVLEQFQKDKEKDVQKETERIKRQISVEKRIQEDLKSEISGLQGQLNESKHGLLAASRLSDQLEQSKQMITTLKIEVSQLKDKLHKNEEQLHNLSSQSDGKVDKSLIKNLIIGFVTTNNNLNKDQIQIFKIIATVLDFSQQDHDKVNLNKPQQGWLSSLLNPQNSQGISEESLSQAFVKFLENESKPRLVPSLLSNSDETPKSRKSSVTVPRQSPNVLSAVVLPTFADFAQNRNSSSILKDVLKDNS